MYNIFNNYQSKRLMLKSYIPGINTSILPNKYFENIFSEELPQFADCRIPPSPVPSPYFYVHLFRHVGLLRACAI